VATAKIFNRRCPQRSPIPTPKRKFALLRPCALAGDLISSSTVEEHTDIAEYKLFYPRFVPNESSLIFSTGRQLFSLSYTGEVQRITLPLDEAMSTPLFGLGGKTALATSEDPISERNLVNIARSNSGDEEAILQPDGNTVAFKSRRTGSEQVWLSSNGVLTQLSNFPLDTRIEGFRWASDGKKRAFLLTSR